MISIRLLGIGLIGPGLENWQTAIPLLKHNGTNYVFKNTIIPAIKMLPANERRRITATIKLALAAAEQAIQNANLHTEDLTCVFASAHGDMEIANSLCLNLATNEKLISPTQFHNSVHNAAAGYWSIAARSLKSTTHITAADSSFSAGLLEAAIQSNSNDKPILLVVFDYPAPIPLSTVVPVDTAFAVALIIQNSIDKATITLTLGNGVESQLTSLELEYIRLNNPAARVLPLLYAIANGLSTRVYLPYLHHYLIIDLIPT